MIMKRLMFQAILRKQKPNEVSLLKFKKAQ